MEMLKSSQNGRPRNAIGSDDLEYSPKLPNLKRKIKHQTLRKKSQERPVKLNSINTSSANARISPQIQIPSLKHPVSPSKPKTTTLPKNPQLSLHQKLLEIAKNDPSPPSTSSKYPAHKNISNK
mmetsp:Transcript_19103/g.18738  ORF Transcript_19103/g.18738 Transcript_19103/m.18738 type:complete len:124 (+) Transcript_19103:754-1125(+)